MTKEQQNLVTIWPRMLEQIEGCEYFAEDLAEVLEAFLDSLAEQDAFGTERQCDPRGDFRNGEWSLLGDVEE